MAICTTTTAGSTVAGALIGQSMIPIPVVGALIGSVVGGYFGDKGGKKISNYLDEKRLTEKV